MNLFLKFNVTVFCFVDVYWISCACVFDLNAINLLLKARAQAYSLTQYTHSHTLVHIPKKSGWRWNDGIEVKYRKRERKKMSSHWQNPNFAARKTDRKRTQKTEREKGRENLMKKQPHCMYCVYRYFCGKIILNFPELKTLLVTDL